MSYVNSLNIFIPRILANITKKYIKNTFLSMNIGDVSYIDLRKRVNDKQSPYSFAFLKLELVNSVYSSKISNLIKEFGSTRLYYDNVNYWELKNYIPHENRVNFKEEEFEEIKKLSVELMAIPYKEMLPWNFSLKSCHDDNSRVELFPTSFTSSDMNMIDNEYMQIEKEIAHEMYLENISSFYNNNKNIKQKIL